MNLALASCAALPPSEVDDHPLHAALRARGAHVVTPAWDDPAIDWSQFDACLIRCTWDYMDRRDAFLAWAARVAEQSVLFNPLPVVAWSTLKTYLRELVAHDLPVAPTLWVEAGGSIDLATELPAHGWQEAFVKPMIGADARETLPFRVDAAGLARAQTHVDRLLQREGVMIQPFLEAVRSEGEYSVIFIDGAATHVVRKVPRPGDYRVMDNHGATDGPAELPAGDMLLARRAREVCEGILGCEGALLYARVDLLRGEDGGMVVNEVELVEPSLFFRHCGEAAEALAVSLLARIRSQ